MRAVHAHMGVQMHVHPDCEEVNGTVGFWKEFWKELGRTVRAALATWHGTARLGALLILGSVAGAVFLAVADWLKH